MTALEELGRARIRPTCSSIGGGIGGLAAAAAAKEKNPDADVLVVEKATSGWAGQANKGAGIWWYLAPEDDADRFVAVPLRAHRPLHRGPGAARRLRPREPGDARAHGRLDAASSSAARTGSSSTSASSRSCPGVSRAPTSTSCARSSARQEARRALHRQDVADRPAHRRRARRRRRRLQPARRLARHRARRRRRSSPPAARATASWACGAASAATVWAWPGAPAPQMRNAEWGPFAQLAGKHGKEPLIGAEDALYNAWHEKLSPRFRGEFEADVCGMTSRGLVPADDGRQRAAGRPSTPRTGCSPTPRRTWRAAPCGTARSP